jgi:predicted ATPase/class 3 adenylate cyclase
MALPTGMVTFLFTDLVGSSARWDEATDDMREAALRHDELIESAIDGHSGHLVKKMGDGFMAVFEDPADAVTTAVDAQVALRTEAWPETVGTIEARMGIHTGPADLTDNDYLGPTVNRAARLEAAGHGGQILVSAATRELVTDRVAGLGFRDLGEHHLRGLTRPERVHQVEAPGLTGEFPPLHTESIPTNLPAIVQPMIGRDPELDEVTEILRDCRLVSITGAGGAGKTTLAIEAARRAEREYPAGVWLVELDGMTDGRRIASEILGTIRRPAPADEDHVELLVQALAGQRSLLILDNCEHLLSDVALVVSRLLRGTDEPKVMTTSRERLDVTGERAWRIPVMSLPDQPTVGAVQESDAGALFVTRAQAADASFVLDDDNCGVVFDLCHRLDGLPLGIELACARIRSMSIDELNRRLDDRFRLLRGGGGDHEARHQTLRDTVAWSYDLLSEPEQRLFRRLSVFAGGFDLEAAETVGTEVVGDDDVLDVLDHLVTQSLVQHDQGRYRMLETIREYGLQMLEQHAESDAAGRRHLEWLSELSRTGGRQLEGEHQLEWLRRFQTEIDNIRAGLGWALERDPSAGVTAMVPLTRFFWMNASETDTRMLTDSRSFMAEGYDWATALLVAAGTDLAPRTRARLQSGLGGMLCIRAGRFQEGIDRLAEAQTLFEELGDKRGLGWALFYDGVAGWGIRSAEETLQMFERSMACHVEADDMAGQQYAGILTSWALAALGRYDEGRAHMDRFAETAYMVKVPNMVAHAADGLALFDAWQDRITEETAARSVESIEAFRSIDNYACLTHALGSVAVILAKQGRVEEPGMVLGVSQAIRDRLNMVIAPYEDHSEAAASAVSTALALDSLEEGPARDCWEAAMAQGRTMEPDEGIDWTIRQLGH